MADEDKVPIEQSPADEEIIKDPDEDTLSIINEVADARHLKAQMSPNQALMSFIKGNIGTGILSMPVILKYAGVWAGLSLLVLCSGFATYCMHLLARVADDIVLHNNIDRSNLDYTEVVFYVLKYGPPGLRKYKGKIKHTINAFLIITQIGCCCVYTLFISQNILLFIDDVIPGVDIDVNATKWSVLTAFCVCLVITPVAIFRSMRMLTHLSMVGNVFSVLGLGLIFAYLAYIGIFPLSSVPAIKVGPNLLIAFSIAVFAVEGIGLVLPIQSRMKDPEVFHIWYGVINTGMITVVSLDAAVAFFGYMAFRDDAMGSITLNVRVPPYYFAPIRPLFVVVTFISYLLQFYIPIVIIGRLMQKLACHRDASLRWQSVHKKSMRAALVWLTFIAAVSIPHLDLMISLIGATASSFLALILPPILYVIRFWPQRHLRPMFNASLVVNLLAFLLGLLAMFGGTITTIRQIIEVASAPVISGLSNLNNNSSSIVSN